MPKVIFKLQETSIRKIKNGDLFFVKDLHGVCGSVYMVGQIEPNVYRLICLEQGNRWNDIDFYNKTIDEVIEYFAKNNLTATYYDGDEIEIVIRPKRRGLNHDDDSRVSEMWTKARN